MAYEMLGLAAMSGICGNEPIIIRIIGGWTPPKPEPVCPACSLVVSALLGIGAYVLWGRMIDANNVLTTAVLGYLGGRFGAIAWGVVTGGLRNTGAPGR